MVTREASQLSRAVALASTLDGAATLLEQALALLRTWPPAADLALAGVDDPADLPVSLADRALLALNEEILGGPLEFDVACALCAEVMTLSLARGGLPAHRPHGDEPGSSFQVREPTWRDLLASGDDAYALLTRCSIGAGATMEDLAHAEGSLSGPLHVTCVSCGSHLELDVDVMALVLNALATVPADLDRDVHVLASNYGWDLAVIEALPDHRRRRLAALARSGQ